MKLTLLINFYIYESTSIHLQKYLRAFLNANNKTFSLHQVEQKDQSSMKIFSPHGPLNLLQKKQEVNILNC